MKQERKPERITGAKLVIPFFITMGILTVVSFLLPLRPTRSQMERRNLTEFPEFSWTALTEGSYFDDITLWFSDTFPGREGWLMLSSQISGLHGYSEIAIAGNLDYLEAQDITPEAPKQTQLPSEDVSDPAQSAILLAGTPVDRQELPKETEAQTQEPNAPTAAEPATPPTQAVQPDDRQQPPKETEAQTQEPEVPTVAEPTTPPTQAVQPDNRQQPPKETEAQTQEPDAPTVTEPTTLPTGAGAPSETEAPSQTQWGGIDAGDGVDVEMNSSAVIQIGDSAFNALGFSEISSKNYAAALNTLAKALEGENVRIVSAPAPTAVGILIESQYLQKMRCASQDETIRFLHSQMDDSIVKVDTYAALVPHNNEYIYFRTDHHWTARGAYYAYAAICEALGYEAVPLEDCEEWDQGEFEGSLYWKAPYPRKLKKDTLYAYVPKANLELQTRSLNQEGTVRPLIQDMTQRDINTKYSAFLFGDNPMVQVTNYDLPDGPTALVIKDSFGNALVPFLAQNYSKVYAIDYRKFYETNIRWFLHVLPVDDVIFAPYLMATQAMDGADMIKQLCK